MSSGIPTTLTFKRERSEGSVRRSDRLLNSLEVFCNFYNLLCILRVPYLFLFINNFFLILKNIRLEDKLAFAVLHMDDDFLNSALDRLTNELLSLCPLSALFIVGLKDDPVSHMVLHRFIFNF